MALYFGLAWTGAPATSWVRFCNNCAVVGVMLLVDSLLHYAVAGFLKIRIDAIDKKAHESSSELSPSNADTTTLDTTDNAHAQVSRKVDKFIGNQSPPRVSILVSLLYLASCLAWPAAPVCPLLLCGFMLASSTQISWHV